MTLERSKDEGEKRVYDFKWSCTAGSHKKQVYDGLATLLLYFQVENSTTHIDSRRICVCVHLCISRQQQLAHGPAAAAAAPAIKGEDLKETKRQSVM
jgi:hypothetical protein